MLSTHLIAIHQAISLALEGEVDMAKSIVDQVPAGHALDKWTQESSGSEVVDAERCLDHHLKVLYPKMVLEKEKLIHKYLMAWCKKTYRGGQASVGGWTS